MKADDGGDLGLAEEGDARTLRFDLPALPPIGDGALGKAGAEAEPVEQLSHRAGRVLAGFIDVAGDGHTLPFADGVFDVVKTPSSTVSIPASFFDDGPGNLTIRARIYDKDQGFSQYVKVITINNVAPTASIGGPSSGYRGQVRKFTGSFSDAGSLDTHAVMWDFGDGSSAVTTSSKTTTHAYAAAGTYIATVTVTTSDGRTVTGRIEFIVT